MYAHVADHNVGSRRVLEKCAFVLDHSAQEEDVLEHVLVLTERQLDYIVDAKLTGKIDIPNCSTMDELVGNAIPFTIKGPIDGPPTILPDFSKIVRQVIQDRVQDAVRDRLRDLLNR